MALIHWWPLTSGFQDVVADAKVTSGSYVPVPNGVFGPGFKNSGSGCITSVSREREWNSWFNSVSMCCWVKINYAECNAYIKTLTYSEEATHPTGCLIGQTSYGGLGIYWRSKNQIYNNGNALLDLTSIEFRGYSRGSNSTVYTDAYTVEYDKWYHMALIADVDKKVLRFYVNGK
jgi:hypothetical protein